MDRERPDVIGARLRRMAELFNPDAPRVDMSAQAVTARLQELSDLSKFCNQLGQLGRSRQGS